MDSGSLGLGTFEAEKMRSPISLAKLKSRRASKLSQASYSILNRFVLIEYQLVVSNCCCHCYVDR